MIKISGTIYKFTDKITTGHIHISFDDLLDQLDRSEFEELKMAIEDKLDNDLKE